MTTASDRWRRVESLCQAALERDAGDRVAFVAEACGGDADLQREVEALLARAPDADGFLSAPIGAIAADVLTPAADLIGRRLGVYEIVSRLGAGGMGEVYRARDTQLGREVAIKVLPPAFIADADRLARFEREARVLASLNHPHIGAIYGVEPIDGARALVLELVDGETLAQRIAKGSRFRASGASARRAGLEIGEALSIARQIAEALDAAHEKGIVHRDLKPANIKITPAGVVKVLDFGLAKAAARSIGSEVSQPPTLTLSGTHEGMLLGTAAYMSPEQARGLAVDKRADIWAFGCVLFEMLTGRMPFPGATISDHIAAILEREPDWTALPSATPAGVRRLLRRCLEKDQTRRLHDVADARIEIDDALNLRAEGSAVAPGPSRRVAPLAIAALAGGAVIALAGWASWMLLRPATRASALPSRFAIALPSSEALNLFDPGRAVALSPDGRHLAYRAGGSLSGGGLLMVRALDALEARPLAGIASAVEPFFSPDSQWIGFFSSPPGVAGWLLAKVSITGGPAITLCPIRGNPLGASWGDDNTIVLATDDPGSGLWQVAASGGEPTVLTKPDSAQGEAGHRFPSVLPGARAVLFTIAASGRNESQVAVLDRRTGAQNTLIRGGSDAEYLDSGHLIYTSGGALRAVRFDAARRELLGDPVPVVDKVMTTATGAAHYAVSRSGTLIYVAGQSGAQTSLVWVDRKGREEPIPAPPRNYGGPRLSPDGTRAAFEMRDPGDFHLWIWDFARRQLTRLTAGPGSDGMPRWTERGQRINFTSDRARPGTAGAHDLYSQAADGTGTAERLTTVRATSQYPTSITPDGKFVIGFAGASGVTSAAAVSGFWVVLFRLASAAGGEPPPQPLFEGTFVEFSPDGRYVAYQSGESGRPQIYVRPFPRVDGGRWQISTAVGTRPAWARNGRELFYLDETNSLTAVSVHTSGSAFSTGVPAKVFDARYSTVLPSRSYDVSSDGRRFLMLKDSPASTSLVVVEHWFEELKAKVGAQP